MQGVTLGSWEPRAGAKRDKFWDKQMLFNTKSPYELTHGRVAR